MPVDDIVQNWDDGVREAEIASNFRLPIEQVSAILAFAAKHEDVPRPVR